jgi:hypothetical protein
MKTIIHSTAALSLVLAVLPFGAHADDLPTSPVPVTPARVEQHDGVRAVENDRSTPPGPARAAPASASTGEQVLLLKNEHTMIGAISRDEDGNYVVRRERGATTLSAEQVWKLCDSLEVALQFLRAQTNLNDADERMRLCDWCRNHDLKALALEEVRAAARLRPGDKRIKRILELMIATQGQKTPTAPRPTEPPPVAPIDLTDDALCRFATHIQPILMNTCASCHIGERGGNFHLVRTYGATLENRRTLQQNLTAVLAQVNLRNPASSPLLLKGVSIHALGMTQAPWRSRAAKTYLDVEQWVRLTVANNPQLLGGEPGPSVASPEVQAPLPPAGPAVWGADKVPMPTPPAPPTASVTATVPVKDVPPAKPEVQKTEFASPSAQPETPATSDPVDPDAFNRQYHPERLPPKTGR